MIYTQEGENVFGQPDDKVYIYPFAKEGIDPAFHNNRLIVRPGSVQLDLERMIVSVEHVQLLIEALLHAVEMAEGGRE